MAKYSSNRTILNRWSTTNPENDARYWKNEGKKKENIEIFVIIMRLSVTIGSDLYLTYKIISLVKYFPLIHRESQQIFVQINSSSKSKSYWK